VLLSDVDGLYTAPPSRNADAEHLSLVPMITAEIEAMAGGAASHTSHGGMTTKIEAGKIATQAGTAMIIAKGTALHPLRALAEGARHTLFKPVETLIAARKRWIMGTLDVCGALHIDAGAARALHSGKSLLPIGVTKVTGDFSRGDAISILDPEHHEIARGLAGLDSDEARLVRGKKSDAAIGLLGVGNRGEIVHRDNLVLLHGAEARAK
jgi:glutamate 5-kinase